MQSIYDTGELTILKHQHKHSEDSLLAANLFASQSGIDGRISPRD